MSEDRLENVADFLGFLGVLCLILAGTSVAVFAVWMLGSGFVWMLGRWGMW